MTENPVVILVAIMAALGLLLAIVVIIERRVNKARNELIRLALGRRNSR